MPDFEFSQRSLDRMNGVNDKLIQLAHRALAISKVDFGIPAYGGKRTTEEQLQLFQAGKSKCDGTDKLSYHQSGNALDFYAYVDGAPTWERGYMAQVAAAFLQAAIELNLQIEWGGLWAWEDSPHIQLLNP